MPPPSAHSRAVLGHAVEAVAGEGYSNFLEAEVDEVRLSSTQRYTTDFVPTRRVAPDAQTMGLWHFDEGTGSVARDASGNGPHFQLAG